MEQEQQGVQVDPSKVINSLVRQLSEAFNKIALLEAYSETMQERLDKTENTEVK